MLDVVGEKVGLLQVELNTISSSFGSLSAKITDMHRSMLARRPPPFPGSIPENGSLKGLAKALVVAHGEYLKLRPSARPAAVAVLFVVQPGERNVMDQRALEYEVGHQSEVGAGAGRIRCVRLTLAEVHAKAVMAEAVDAEGEARNVLTVDGLEMAVVYFRAG
jgi:glutathione synthase